MALAAPTWFSSLLCLAALSAVPAADDLTKAQLAYHQAGKAVIEMVQSKQVDAAQVEAKVVEMERQAVVLARAYAAKFPEGRKLIDTVIAQVAAVDAQGVVTGLGPMKAQSYAEIEDLWHDGSYFKKHDLGVDFEDEKNEHFTDPIHTMVHPMMVLRAAMTYQTSKADADLKAMKEEMDEGLEQAEKTRETLTK